MERKKAVMQQQLTDGASSLALLQAEQSER